MAGPPRIQPGDGRPFFAEHLAGVVILDETRITAETREIPLAKNLFYKRGDGFNRSFIREPAADFWLQRFAPVFVVALDNFLGEFRQRLSVELEDQPIRFEPGI